MFLIFFFWDVWNIYRYGRLLDVNFLDACLLTELWLEDKPIKSQNDKPIQYDRIWHWSFCCGICIHHALISSNLNIYIYVYIYVFGNISYWCVLDRRQSCNERMKSQFDVIENATGCESNVPLSLSIKRERASEIVAENESGCYSRHNLMWVGCHQSFNAW